MAVCGNEYRGPGYPQVHGKVFCNKPDNHVFGLTWLERQHWNLGDMAAPKRLAWWDGDQKAEQDRIHGHKDW